MEQSILPADTQPPNDLSVSGNVNSSSTRFTSDTGNVRSSHRTPTFIESIIDSMRQGEDDDIIKFLKKPYRLRSGQLSNADVGTLWNSQLPTEVFDNSFQSAKLANILMVRCDIHLTLTVNANRFQQGRYILAWIPNGGLALSDRESAWYRMHNANLTTLTQCPHVEFDLSQQTMVSLVVPHTTSQVFNIANIAKRGAFINGNLVLVTYEPLSVGSTGSTTCEYTCWAHLDNIHLAGVTSQSGEEEKKADDLQQSYVDEAVPLLNELPKLLTPQKPSWYLDLLSRGSKSFGFSKPNISKPVVRMDRKPMVYTNNADTANQAAPLGVSADNCVVVPSGLGAPEVDEMSYDFIKSQYAFYGKFDITTSDLAGTFIAKYGHNPFGYVVPLTPGYTFTPVAMLSRLHQYWRGGMKFRFKIVKTEFHSGRLAVSYAPFDRRYIDPTYSLDQTAVLWREIIDLRETAEFEVCVPYISTDVWRVAHNDDAVGMLYIHIVDKIVCPETVAQKVTVIVEVAGDNDLEFSFPLEELHWQPYAPPLPQSAYKSIGCEMLGENKPTNEAELQTIGESINSISQLLKRIYCLHPSAGFHTNVLYNIFDGILVSPYGVAHTNRSALGFTTKSTYNADAYSRFAHFYVFSSGGINFGIKQIDQLHSIDVAPDYSYSTIADITNPTNVATAYRNGSSLYSHIVQTEGPMTWVSLPMYERRIARPNAIFLKNSVFVSSDVKSGAGEPLIRFTSYNASSDKAYSFYRSVTDDFRFSYWLGTVPYLT